MFFSNQCPLQSAFHNEDFGKLLLRVSLAGLMLFHGFHKLFYGIDFIHMLVQKAGLPDVLSYGVYMGELIIPFLLILGLCTRVSAFIFGGTMFFATFLAFGAHWSELDPKTGGLMTELPLLFLFASLSIVFLGAGKYSLDAKWCRCSKNA